MTKKKKPWEWAKINGWGARTVLTERQEAEIQTCLHCPLPDCVSIRGVRCPLCQARQAERNKRDVEQLIAAWWTATGTAGE